jgi:hypothetical protein
LHFSRAKAWAVAAPMPELAPVIRTLFPWSEVMAEMG